MELTGKCKEAFEKWYAQTECGDLVKELHSVEISVFYKVLTPSMQYGVLVDFFDSVGIEIFLVKNRICFWVRINQTSYNTYEINRTEARTAALKKANEIFNNRQ